MINRFLMFITVTGLTLSLYACIAVPNPEHAKDTFKIKQTIEYILPKNVHYTSEKGVSFFGSVAAVGGDGTPVIVFSDPGYLGFSFRMLYNSTDSVLNVEMRNQEYYTVYAAKAHFDKKSDGVMIDLTPLSKDYVFRRQSASSLGQVLPGYEVPFTEQDFLNFLCSASISFREEINSPYSSESVYANFKRNLKEERFSQEWKDPITGKIYKTAYVLTYDQSKTLNAYP